jgi:hypothetical protein
VWLGVGAFLGREFTECSRFSGFLILLDVSVVIWRVGAGHLSFDSRDCVFVVGACGVNFCELGYGMAKV